MCAIFMEFNNVAFLHDPIQDYGLSLPFYVRVLFTTKLICTKQQAEIFKFNKCKSWAYNL